MYKCPNLNTYSRQWLSEFIRIYRENECLWREKHTNSRNRKSRDAAYALLLAKMQEVDSTANHNNVIGRIQQLRRNCKKMFLKKQKNPQYRPTLWYYNELEPTLSSPNEDEPPTHAPQILVNLPKPTPPKTNHNYPTENLKIYPIQKPPNTEPVPHIVKSPQNHNLTKRVYFSQQSNGSAVQSPGYDEDDAFALSTILELGEMERIQFLKTKKIINETIAKGLLNEL